MLPLRQPFAAGDTAIASLIANQAAHELLIYLALADAMRAALAREFSADIIC